MIVTARDLLEDAKRILGACSLPDIYGKMTDAVQILANTGEFDPLLGVIDICVSNQLVTLPREVYTVLAVNIGGRPAVGRDATFQFHLNGPGDCLETCALGWRHFGLVPTYRPMQRPGKLVAFLSEEEDENAELWAYGYDNANRWITSRGPRGEVVDGYQVPTIVGYAVPDADAPLFSRVSRIRKAPTIGSVRLSSFDADATTGTQLGVFDYDETEPSYQQIKLERSTDWIRVMYRRRVYEIKSLDAQIPLPSPVAVKMMIHALKYYDEGNVAQAAGFEATARRFLAEAVRAITPPTRSTPQINPEANAWDPHDGDIT
jgi:hypothetical protein